MSIQHVSNVFDTSSLSSAQTLVMAVLADHASPGGIAWPGMKLLGERTKMTQPTLRGHIKTLTEDGWLKVLTKGNGRGVITRYALNVDRLECEAQKARASRKDGKETDWFPEKGEDSYPFSDDEKGERNPPKGESFPSKGERNPPKGESHGSTNRINQLKQSNHISLVASPARPSPGKNKTFLWASEEELEALREKWSPQIPDYDVQLAACRNGRTFGDNKTEKGTIDYWMHNQVTKYAPLAKGNNQKPKSSLPAPADFGWQKGSGFSW